VETIYTIPINEAFDTAQNECPLCALKRRLADNELDLILGASMMEPDIRIKTNEQGFCHAHYDKMLGMKNRLGLALMLESHLDEVKKHLVGRDVWFDTSSTFWELPAEQAKEIALAHGTDRILFGSDYPASLPGQAIADVLTMGLSDEDNEKIFYRNACKLLGLKE
jgi:hypothetical protein